MNIVVRADASHKIGAGHIMRCLTLADKLRKEGSVVLFICRNLDGHLEDTILERGHKCFLLNSKNTKNNAVLKVDREALPVVDQEASPVFDLDTSWQQDAKQVTTVIDHNQMKINWIIVDHYALDERWEREMRNTISKIMVIDDLADRKHDCDMLLDQTYGRGPNDYKSLVPSDCKVITGAEYALLRDEFSEWRSYSLARRKKPKLKRIFISMGFGDPDNTTSKVIDAMDRYDKANNFIVTVVMSASSPNLKSVLRQVDSISLNVEVVTNANNMAKLMAECDLAIGAGGTTSWERCCLGVPSLILIIAENQKKIALELDNINAAMLLGDIHDGRVNLSAAIEFFRNIDNMKEYVHAASAVTDGLGCHRVMEQLYAR